MLRVSLIVAVIACLNLPAEETLLAQKERLERELREISERGARNELKALVQVFTLGKTLLDAGQHEKALPLLKNTVGMIEENEKAGFKDWNPEERQQVRDLFALAERFAKLPPDPKKKYQGVWMESWTNLKTKVQNRVIRYISADGKSYSHSEADEYWMQDGKLYVQNKDGWLNEYTVAADGRSYMGRNFEPRTWQKSKPLPAPESTCLGRKVADELKAD
ncbi:MAG: hypothetical protein HS116_02240 [Planctomycetes bacterium]|nr:hypothetical protein [Planctomycetota bacterium]